MAQQGKPIPDDDRRQIERLNAIGKTKSEIAELVDVSRPTVYKYTHPSTREKKEQDFTR